MSTTEVPAEVVERDLAPWEMPDEGDQIAVQAAQDGGVVAINRSEVEAQLAAAHRFKRSITSFMRDSISMATISVPVAESCIYSLPRGGKTISGPSVRLAEICAASYGNLHVAARVADVGEKEVTAQGVAWDLERNVRVTTEVRRRITNKDGKRYNDDMILMTANAAASIALRNAVFRVVPRAYVDTVYEKVRLVAIGKAETLAARRADLLGRLVKMGATNDRVLAALELKDVGDITLEHMERLIGLGTAIKSGDKTVDEVFPEVAPQAIPGAQPAEQGRRVSLRKGGQSAPATNATLPSATKTDPSKPSDPPANPVTGEIAGAKASSEMLKEIDELNFATKTTAEQVLAWYPGVAALADLTAAQAVDAIEKLHILDDQGPAAAATDAGGATKTAGGARFSGGK